MPHNRDDMYYHPPGTTCYDVQYKSGALENGVTETEICDRRPADIRWLWVVEQNRYAMPGGNTKSVQAVISRLLT